MPGSRFSNGDAQPPEPLRQRRQRLRGGGQRPAARASLSLNRCVPPRVSRQGVADRRFCGSAPPPQAGLLSIIRAAQRDARPRGSSCGGSG